MKTLAEIRAALVELIEAIDAMSEPDYSIAQYYDVEFRVPKGWRLEYDDGDRVLIDADNEAFGKVKGLRDGTWMAVDRLPDTPAYYAHSQLKAIKELIHRAWRSVDAS